jgi:chromosomal replication initiator protein
LRTQDVTTLDTEVVAAVRARLARRIGEDRYEMWFGAQTQLVLDGDALRVLAPTQFYCDWLRKSFREPLESSCREITGRTPAVEFQVAPDHPKLDCRDRPEADRRKADRPEAASVPPSSCNGSNSGGKAATVPFPAARCLPSAPSSPPASNGDARPVLRGRRFATFASFVAGPGNQVALTSARVVAAELGKLNPLFLYGPTAVGKTHLLEGVYKEARKDRQCRAVYLSAEQFTNYFVDAVRGSGLPNFRRKYRELDLLIVDDVQFFCGKKGTIAELLHTIDTVLRAGRQVVCAADRLPGELPGLGPELLTRLESGLVCPMLPPDHQVRLGILRQWACELELPLPLDVAEFIAAHLTAHARELSGAMKLLKANCLALGCELTLALAEEALAETIRHSAPIVRLADIEQAVCGEFGLEPKTLQTGAGRRSVNHPRMLAMWLARKYTRVALSEIGRYFGRRSHSTVISAQRKVNGWVASGQPLSLANQQCTAEEAIRRVEARLRTG